MEALRERFGKYHVIGKIAQGGMAEVYKVKTVGIAGFEKVQALKRILPDQAREARFIRSFVDEARIAVELTHRNIVQVFDFGKADGELFLAMELLEGKDLRTAMADGVARDLLPSAPVAAYILAEVAAGLDYAHRKTDGYGGSLGIVHCDVSPSNVMLSTDGYVKILDFGIARASFASALERRRLRGKPRYMAPEQTLGEAPTFAADVFALGIIAWELFTGLPLFRGADLKSTLEAVRRTTPPRVDQIAPGVPREIADAIAVALRREPRARGTAADLGTACARLAMLGGATRLAEWLAAIGSPATVTSARPWLQPEASVDAEPVAPPTAVRRPSTTALDGPPRRPTPTVALRESYPAFLPERLSVTRLDAPRFEEPEEATQFGLAAADEDMAEVALDDALAGTSADTPGPAPAPGPEAVIDRATEAATEAATEQEPEPAAEHTVRMSVARLAPSPTAASEAIDDELPAPPLAATAERRRAVIVAAVLSGALPATLRPIARSLGELAYQRGGVLAGQDEDGLVVAFGLEIAGEDDVAIAMGWALDATALARDAGLALQVGARTGVPTTAGAVPADAADEARALAREAAPERPRFVGATGRVTSGLYALREVPASRRPGRLGKPRTPGAPERGPVIEIVGPRTFDERDRAARTLRGKLFGRAAVLEQLGGHLAEAIARDRRIAVLLSGAAGCGKTRLVAELVARHPEARVINVAATPASRFAPFAVVIDVYQAALGLPPARGREARAQVAARLQHLAIAAGIRPDRARAIGGDLARAMELRDGAAVGAPEVADLRPRISAGLAAFRAALADRARPTLTIIEDMHHADNPSLEVLRHILAVTAAHPELLVLTTRPEGGLGAPGVDAALSIGELVGGELRALIADRLGDAATPANIAAVLARGGGNPLFVEELAQAIREAGPSTQAVPASARDVMAARVDRLSPAARLALRYATVLGGAPRVRLIEELLGDDALADPVAELGAAGLVEASSAAADGGEGALRLACGLVGEVVYEALSPRARREAHARVGGLLASRFFAGRDEPPAVIADHLERAGEPAGAAAFWLRAGRLALAASDAEAAVACFTRTLALDQGAQASTARTRTREALAGRIDARRLQGDVVSDAGDLDALAALCATDPARLAEIELRRAERCARQGDTAGMTLALAAAAAHAAATGDEQLRADVRAAAQRL